MPVGISSAARNLFLLGSSGADVVLNFFTAIDQSSSPDDQFVSKAIKYSEYDEKYILGLQAEDANSKKHALVEKRDGDGVLDWDFEIESTNTENTILTDIHLDVNGKLIVAGSAGDVPFVSRYTNNGVIEWASTTNSANVRYNSVASDSNGQYYACGNTDESGSAQAFVEKYDSTGNPGWGKSAFILGSDVVLHALDCNSRGEVVAAGYLEDINSNFKGYFVKIDTTSGQVIWDRTLEITDRDWGIVPVTEINDVMIDGNDFIYIVGSQFNGITRNSAGFICKYSPEGNMLWQKETPIGSPNSGRWRYNCVKADTATGQIIVLGSYFENTSDEYGVLVKYSSDGRKIFTRVLESTEASPPEFGTLSTPRGGMALDADPSFYYILFTDQETNPANTIPDKYTYGKVSSSGNGLGAFSYDTGDTNTIEYYIQDIDDRIGRLSDGSVRNDTSDLATNILNPTKIMFDDLATPIANKKRQMDRAGDFVISGSPSIRPTDFETRELTTDGYGVPPQKNYIGLSESLQPTSTSGTGTTNNTWSRQSTNVTVQVNNLSNPLGVGSGAERYNISATNGRRLEYGVPSGVFVAGQTYTYSWWMKAITVDAQWKFQAYSAGNSNNSIRIADRYGNILENTSTTNTSSYKPKDTEWHRVVWTFTANNTTGSPVGGYNNSNETGNLWYLWGAQLVDGPDPLPYYRNHNGSPENAAGTEHAPSIVNGAYEFDKSEILQIGPVPEIEDEFTVEIWFKSDTHSNWQNPIDCNYGSQDLLGNGVVNSGNVGPRLEINASGSFFWAFGSTLAANDPYIALPAGSGSTGVWYHSVVTYSGGGVTDGKSYINGEFFQQSYQSSGGTAGWVGEFRNVILGRGFTLATRYFDGQIGEVRIYPRALTAAQVYQNYNATKYKYINEAPDTAPKIGPGIVNDSNLLLNYDFGNRATYDNAENVIGSSEDFTTTGSGRWAGAGNLPNANVTPNYAISPFGEMKATRMINTDATPKFRRWQPNVSANGNYDTSGQWNCSVYAKALSNSCILRINSYDGISDKGSYFDLVNGAVTSSYGSPDGISVEAVGNGWYRISQTTTNAANGGDHQLHLDPGADLLLFGAQMEKGSTPGRYIRTYRSAITAPTTVKNLSSSSYTGTLNGPTFNTDGSFQFDGTDDDIETGLSWSPANQFSFTMWFNLDTIKEYHNLVDMFEDSTRRNFQLFVEGDGDFRIFWGKTNATAVITGTVANEWYFGAFTSDGENGDLYRYGNGTLNTVSAEASGGSYFVRPLVLGRRGDSDANGFVDGKIGEFQFYNRELTAAEVLQNYNATRGKYGV